jgi:hypothetical protein
MPGLVSGILLWALCLVRRHMLNEPFEPGWQHDPALPYSRRANAAFNRDN